MPLPVPGSLSPPVLQLYVSGVSEVCCICFIGCCKSRSWDVAHVAYVAIVFRACCNSMFRVFQMFQIYVLSVFIQMHVAIVFIWMLHMLHVFYSDICVWLQWFSSVFQGCFSSVFRSMFQVFQLPSDVCCNRCFWMFQK